MFCHLFDPDTKNDIFETHPSVQIRTTPPFYTPYIFVSFSYWEYDWGIRSQIGYNPIKILDGGVNPIKDMESFTL